MRKKLFLVSAAILGTSLSWAGCKMSRAGYEGPAYRVIASHGEVEIRRYGKMTGAVTGMAPKKSSARNSEFGRLFRFIDGGNEREEKIAMTSPVFMETDDKGKETSMIFLMPEKTVTTGVPKPSDNKVSVQPIPGGDFAVLRFTGYRSNEAQSQAIETLRQVIAKAGLKTRGAPLFAYYDPPWIPEALRRNEVIWRVAEEK